MSICSVKQCTATKIKNGVIHQCVFEDGKFKYHTCACGLCWSDQ